MAAGTGTLPGVPEIHGNVHHHSQPEGHLPPPGRHLAQIPSQVDTQILSAPSVS